MKKRMTFGMCLIMLSLILGVVSLVRFLSWGNANGGMDTVIAAGLIVAILMDVLVIWKDSQAAIILATVGYTVAAVKLLTNSVGSFVDAFQGINMFGDATQVGTIVNIASVMFISVLFSIVASFMKHIKE